MAASYEFLLTDDKGSLIQTLLPTRFSASLDIYKAATLKAEMNAVTVPNRIERDWMIQVWRKSPGYTNKLIEVYFVLAWEWFESNDGSEKISMTGYDPKCLLWRRIVAAYSGSSQAKKDDYADDMMKEIVTESQSDAVAPTPDAGTRDWGDRFSVDADVSDAPQIQKSFSFKQLLTPNGGGVLSDIAETSATNGTLLFFDVVPIIESGSISFKFVTKTNQPGQDLTHKGVMFSREYGNLANAYLEYNYKDAYNYVYSAGQGTRSSREVQQAYDDDRYNASIWSRTESFKDARNEEEPDEVLAAAETHLRDGRPIIRIGGSPLETSFAKFGIDWDHGDKVRVSYRGFENDQIVKSTALSMNNNGAEAIRASFDDF